MKTLQFWMIALVVILLSSCGGKKKITKENGEEILSEVLGYPYIIATTENYQFWARGDKGDFLLEKKIIKQGVKAGSRSEAGYVYFADYDSLTYYVPQHLAINECRVNEGRPLKLCGSFALAKESIAYIDNISEESDDGKITIQFTISRDLSDFYGAFTTSSRDRIHISNILNNYENVSVLLQRSEDGWMVLERNDLKGQLMNGDAEESYYYKAYDIDEFLNVENIFNYYEIAAG